MITTIRGAGMLILCLLILPFGMGLALCRTRKQTLVYFGGLMASWTVFELLAMIFHTMLWSLRAMTGIWMGICVVVAMAGYLRGGKQIFQTRWGEHEPWNTVQKILLVLVGAFVVLQTVNTVFGTYYGNWDDETYCAVAVTSWYTDTVYRCSTTAGTLLAPFHNVKYVVASWPVYSAALAILSGLHPTVVYRTLLPLLEIPASWWIGGAILTMFFRKERTRTLMSLLLFQLLFLVAAEKMTGTGIEWWMVVNCWTGKSVGGGMVVPLILWVMMELYDAPDAVQRLTLWKILFLTSCAACFVSASLFFVVPVQLALWGAVYLLFTRRYRETAGICLCLLPPSICAVLTLF